jgi:hypothetical protein
MSGGLALEKCSVNPRFFLILVRYENHVGDDGRDPIMDGFGNKCKEDSNRFVLFSSGLQEAVHQLNA